MPNPVQVDTTVNEWMMVPSALDLAGNGPNWQLTLSGVALVNFKGYSSKEWIGSAFIIKPNLLYALKFGIDHDSTITVPNARYSLGFMAEQWSALCTLNSVFDANQSVNAGFSVNDWRHSDWDFGLDFHTKKRVNNLFAGIEVDAAVRDSDAYLYRIGYSISVLGKIAILFPADDVGPSP